MQNVEKYPGEFEEYRRELAYRLNMSRMMAGLSWRAFADKVGITKSDLEHYKNGRHLPAGSDLLEVARLTKLPLDFFMDPQTVKIGDIDFRKKSALSKNKIERIKLFAQDYFEQCLFIENVLGINQHGLDVIGQISVNNYNDVERAALKIREVWQLGHDEIANVVGLLEQNSVKVFLTDADAQFDGFSLFYDGVPMMVLNKSCPVVCIRFTALHELGHLVLKFNSKFSQNEIEKLCNRFAGAMLIPEMVFKAEFGGKRSRIDVGEVVVLKERYGMSYAAIMYRAKDLELITDDCFKNYCITSNQQNWRTNEPGTYKGQEISNRLEQLVVRAVSLGEISTSRGAALLRIPLIKFREKLNPTPMSNDYN